MKKQEREGAEAKMPWSRAARLLLARETAAGAKGSGSGSGEEEKSNKASSSGLFEDSSRFVHLPRTSMPPWDSSDDEESSGDDDDEEEKGEKGEKGKERRRQRLQRDDGAWPFALLRSADGRPCLVLEVALGVLTSSKEDVELDVRPRFVRVFARGSLLCARLPARVDRERATARRSLASGKLVVEMPLEDPRAELDEACIREWKKSSGGRRGGGREARKRAVAAPAAAAVVVVVVEENENSESDEEDASSSSSSPPPL